VLLACVGKDGKLITARSVSGGLGYVREISVVDTNVLEGIIHHGHLLAIASLVADEDG
jgi:acetylglutamate kinase